MPVPPAEEPILQYFLSQRSLLSKLKQDRSQYLHSKDVTTMYNELLTKVHELYTIRGNTDESHNRVDSVVDDVFQLISLAFITVGLKNSAPATYASLNTVQHLLEHLNESKVYTHHDLKPIKERLDEISAIVNNNDESRPTNVEEDLLLNHKLDHCLNEYRAVEANLESIHPDLQSVLDKLLHIRSNLLSLIAQSKTDNVRHEAVERWQGELHELETHRDSAGKFVSLETGKVEEMGQNVLNGLLDDCHDFVNDLQHTREFKMDENLQPIYDTLIETKTTLENLLVTRRWTLRETDLFTYQKLLSDIDSKRVGGKFPTKGDGDSQGQSILLYLLRRCYAIVYKLLESSEPVSESLQRIHNQLSTVRRCLLDLKRMGGVANVRELYPYQLKLGSLDNTRVDGKFYDSEGNIPEGQGTLNALLAECFDIVHELKVECEEREDDQEEEEVTVGHEQYDTVDDEMYGDLDDEEDYVSEEESVV